MIEVGLDARTMGNLLGRINWSAQRRADRIAHEAAEMMLDEANALIETMLINDRPAHRRRGGMKIKHSLEAVVEGEGTPRVTAILRTKSGARHEIVAALNYGSDPHRIDAVSGEYMWMPMPGSGPIRQAYGKANKRFRSVLHPGTTGLFFMEEAQRRAKLRLRR